MKIFLLFLSLFFVADFHISDEVVFHETQLSQLCAESFIVLHSIKDHRVVNAYKLDPQDRILNISDLHPTTQLTSKVSTYFYFQNHFKSSLRWGPLSLATPPPGKLV
jgi:hypothetical protein